MIKDIIKSNEKNQSNVIISNKSRDQSNETVNITCTESNEHYPIPGSCDSYIRCQVSSTKNNLMLWTKQY